MAPSLESYILKVLLADDDKDDCLLFTDALQEIDLPTDVTTTRNGQQLMEYLHSCKVLPDILFLDLNMPRKNGYECLSEIKSAERLNKIPVIVISTSSDRDIVDLLYKQGARYYLCKPGNYDHLITLVGRAITLSTGQFLQDNPHQPARKDFVLSPLVKQR